MKINEVLTEASKKEYKKKELEVGRVADYLRKNCSQFLSNNLETPLYRGTWSEYESGAVKIDTASGTRKSENTWNYYTLLIDNSPYYQNWPKRSKSLICTTDFMEATGYGNVMALIPEDGAKIGVVPASDMWHVGFDCSAVYGKGHTIDFEFFPYLMHRIRFPDSTYAQMVKHASSREFAKQFKEEFTDATIEPKDFIPYMLKQTAPEKLGMQMRSTTDFKTTDFKQKECWVEGKCVLIDIKSPVWKQIKAAFK